MLTAGGPWSGLEQATATQPSDPQPFSWHLEIAKNRRIKILPMMASRSISPCGRHSGAASAHLFHQQYHLPPPARRFPRSIRRLDTALTPSSAGNITTHDRFGVEHPQIEASTQHSAYTNTVQHQLTIEPPCAHGARTLLLTQQPHGTSWRAQTAHPALCSRRPSDTTPAVHLHTSLSRYGTAHQRPHAVGPRLASTARPRY